MKIIKKNVYYCEHCKKKGLSSYYMGRHEKGCTANPKRICKLCEGVNIGDEVAELKKRFRIYEDIYQVEKVEWFAAPVTLKEIKDLADNCPNCTLAILRQTKLLWECCGLEKFDYKTELMAALREKEADRISNMSASCFY